MAKTTSYKLSRRSQATLATVHPDLQQVVRLAITISPVDFAVIDGMRSKKRQRQLYKAGRSRTMNSRHLTGHAVDLAAWIDGRGISWYWPYYSRIATAMLTAARKLSIPVEWGGNWKNFYGI